MTGQRGRRERERREYVVVVVVHMKAKRGSVVGARGGAPRCP